MNRRQALYSISAIGTALGGPGRFSQTEEISKRPIPATGEKIGVIGVGTWQTFDVGQTADEQEPLREVLTSMVGRGSTVIDSSPMYGNSERVVGHLSAEAGVNDRLFIATKVWTSGEEAGRRQIEESFRLLRRKKLDLVQVHNLLDWKTHLKTLRQWKEEKRIRYIGITHYLDSMHDEMAEIISANSVDFIQVNYSLRSRNAEKRLLPTAADRGVAVLINRPFEGGALFLAVRGKTLPTWGRDFGCDSWAQFFLKFIISNQHVTCAIPGTSKVTHLLDNLKAGTGALPDQRQRERMTAVLE